MMLIDGFKPNANKDNQKKKDNQFLLQVYQ